MFTPVLSGDRVAQSLYFCLSYWSTIVCLFVSFLLVIIVSVFLRVTDSDYNFDISDFSLLNFSMKSCYNGFLKCGTATYNKIPSIWMKRKVHTCTYFYWLDIRRNTNIYLNIFVDFLWVSITFLLVDRFGGHDVQMLSVYINLNVYFLLCWFNLNCLP